MTTQATPEVAPTVISLPEQDPTQQKKGIGRVIDNQDLVIDLDYAERLKESSENFGYHWSQKPWTGIVWYQDGQWHDEIRLRGKFVAHYACPSLEDLFHHVYKLHEEEETPDDSATDKIENQPPNDDEIVSYMGF
jgi:hypothetical protein